MEKYWSDGYRQDCSGYVSMAWNLGSNEWTGSLAKFGARIERAELQPGDMLLFHNPSESGEGLARHDLRRLDRLHALALRGL